VQHEEGEEEGECSTTRSKEEEEERDCAACDSDDGDANDDEVRQRRRIAMTTPPVRGLRILEPGNPSRVQVGSWVPTPPLSPTTRYGASVVNDNEGNRMPAQQTPRRTTTRRQQQRTEGLETPQ
jgi:hypothetical protein